MTQPAKQEPSIEEILASIRRIIAEDEPAKESPPSEAVSPQPLHAAVPPMPTNPPPAGLTSASAGSSASVMRDEEIDSKLTELRAMSRQAPSASAEEASNEGPAAAEPDALRRPSASEGLLSPATTAALDAAFQALAQVAQPRSGPTVEELVSELIRPMLKTWLDDNLPAIVERLVRAEIERVSRARD
jgi:cell pole-organizing protein PopZ